MEQIDVKGMQEVSNDGDRVPRDIDEVIKTAGSKGAGRFLNSAEVDKGLKKVSIVMATDAYDKTFVDKNTGEKRIRTFIDVIVKSLSDYRNGEELTFSMNLRQVETMRNLFGSDRNQWPSKIIRLITMPTNKGKTIVIDKD